uniref:Uncharacterized protein n=2 Tax=Avena sativa TaxID=4498 RepID=A0ACD5WFV0_AVESA
MLPYRTELSLPPSAPAARDIISAWAADHRPHALTGALSRHHRVPVSHAVRRDGAARWPRAQAAPVRPRGRAAGRGAILRTEAAVSGISRKAAAASSQQSTSLWPRAVLEALDSAVASCNWESALEVPNSFLHTTCSIVAHLVRMTPSLRKQRWYEPKSRPTRVPAAWPGYGALQDNALRGAACPNSRRVHGAYGYSGMLDKALATVDRMKGAAAGCNPDEYTFSAIINCCCKSCCFDLIPAVLDEMAYMRLGCNVVTHNGIIDGYGKAGMLDEMAGTLSNMLEGGENVPDIYTMNSVIWAGLGLWEPGQGGGHGEVVQ